jgi:asparagine synthase (glutamine-hydrolysing)
MCGIIGQAGKFDSDKYNFISQLNKLEHRGPDEKGFYFAKDIRLGCCRLAIVDKELNKQPMSYNQIHVVFNGEIYNFQSLKADLIAKGLSFTTNGDTEVILKLFQVYGETFVNKLNGMFAIAIWDDSNKNLLLFRDRMGQKPLFYKIEKDSIYFSSEMKSFLPLAKKDSLDLTQINSVLCLGYVNTGKTVINTVRSLIPGSYLKWRKGNFQVTKFWNINENLERTKIFNSQELTQLLFLLS